MKSAVNKTISVVIPVYNIENYIDACLDSVTAQTYPNLEIILVNDGSSDNSEAICRKYAEKDSRIKIIRQENQGLSAARNAGVAASTGDYIAFVDGDDILHNDYFKTLIDLAEENDADIAVLKYVYIDSGKEFAGMHGLESEKTEVITNREAALRIERDSERYMIIACGKLYRCDLKELLTFPVGKMHEDEFFTYRVLYSANKVVVSDRKYYGYLRRGSSIMGKFTAKRMYDALEGMKEAIEFFKDQNDEELYKWAVRRYLFRIIIDYYRIMQEKSDNREWASDTRELFLKEYEGMYREVKRGTSMLQAAAFGVFRISPFVYCRFCDVFLKYTKDE